MSISNGFRAGGSGGFDWERYQAELDEHTAVTGTAPDDPASTADIRSRGVSEGSAEGRNTATGPHSGRMPVDGVTTQRSPRVDFSVLRGARRRPVVPSWLRSSRDAAAAVRWAVGFAGHVAAYHAVRVPVYVGRLVFRAPCGLWRVASGAVRWLLDWEGEPVRQAAATRNDAELYLRLARVRDGRVRARGWAAAGIALLGLAGLIWLLVAVSDVWQWATLCGIVALLGLVGASADKPLLDTAVIVGRAEKLTSHVVTRALTVLGIGGISSAVAKDAAAIRFPAPITRDGPGWRADIDLPYGVTAAEVIERRDKLASGLGRPLGCVWPEGDHDISPGRLRLWVGDQDMALVRQPAWPLAKTGTVDVFRPFPFGTDPRGRNVDIELMYTNVLIGSIPGAGKTFALRLPLLAAALDPRVEVWVFELKGTGDLDPLQPICRRYGSGADDDTAEAALAALRDLKAECGRRATAIKKLPRDLCPENKVTPELAATRSLGLHPLVVAVDECQELFSHPDYGKEAGELAEKVIKLGRALGICLLLATQRPDAKSLPTGVSANMGTRFCLRVMGQLENDMILGTSSYKNGIRATMFTKRDKGLGYLVGAGDEPHITKTFYVDQPRAEAVIARAAAARRNAGTLPDTPVDREGDARGQCAASRDLLTDLLAVWPTGEKTAWNSTLVDRLAELRPDTYRQWAYKNADLSMPLDDKTKTEQLTHALRSWGIKAVDVGRRIDGKPVTRRGLARTALEEKATHTRGRESG